MPDDAGEADESDPLTEDDVVVQTANGERYESMGYNKSGEDENDQRADEVDRATSGTDGIRVATCPQCGLEVTLLRVSVEYSPGGGLYCSYCDEPLQVRPHEDPERGQ